MVQIWSRNTPEYGVNETLVPNRVEFHLLQQFDLPPALPSPKSPSTTFEGTGIDLGSTMGSTSMKDASHAGNNLVLALAQSIWAQQCDAPRRFVTETSPLTGLRQSWSVTDDPPHA